MRKHDAKLKVLMKVLSLHSATKRGKQTAFSLMNTTECVGNYLSIFFLVQQTWRNSWTFLFSRTHAGTVPGLQLFCYFWNAACMVSGIEITALEKCGIAFNFVEKARPFNSFAWTRTSQRPSNKPCFPSFLSYIVVLHIVKLMHSKVRLHQCWLT